MELLEAVGDMCLIPGESRPTVGGTRQTVVGICRENLGEQLSRPAVTSLVKACVQSKVKHTPSLATLFDALRRCYCCYDVLFTIGALYRNFPPPPRPTSSRAKICLLRYVQSHIHSKKCVYHAPSMSWDNMQLPLQ